MAEDNNNSTMDLTALDKPPLVQGQFKPWNRTPAKLQKPDTCLGCELYTCSDGFSRAEGKGTIPLLILAEALGEAECRDGLPLRPYAPSGSVVEKAIRQLGLDRQQLVLSNVVVCRPPGNELEGTPYERAAIDKCSQYLDETIAKYRPKAILGLGNVPLQTLTGLAGKDRGIGMVRGYVFWSDKYNLPVIPTYHPSFVRRGGLKLFWVLRHDLAKAVALAKGQPVDWVRAETPSELVENAGVKYFISPRAGQILDISGYQPHSGFRLAYDIETDYSMKDEEELSAVGTQITQIQFSWMKNSGVAYTWGEIGAEGLVEEWLRSSAPKAGHNAWRFDNPLLRAAGMGLGGELHDTMVMWHCYQPDLPQGLQFVASFFGMRFPWKHMASQNIGVYGVADVDAVMHIWDRLPEVMKKKVSAETGQSVWDGYVNYFVKLQPVLEKMQTRGIGIDVVAREELRAKVEKEKAEVYAQVQGLVPSVVKKRKVWKTWPEDLKEELESLKQLARIVIQEELEKAGKKVTKKALAIVIKPKDLAADTRAAITAKYGYQWDGDTLYKELDYNPSSTMQLREILKHYKVEIPLDHLGNETTGKGELVKLLRKCKVDEVIQIIQMTMKYRQADKVIGTYIDGAGWTPDDRGRIHTTFTYKSATWQLTSTQPNIQNIPKHTPLGKDVRGLVVAAPGNLLVECDYSSFHVLTLGFNAESANYMRLARTDAHSYVAAHMLKTRPGVDEETREWIKDLDGWLRLDDDQLKAKLRWIKQRYGKGLRQQAKAGILGVGLGLGVDRLHSNNEESFNPSEEVAEQWLRDNPKAQFYSAIAKSMKPVGYFPHSMQVMLAQEKLGKQAAKDLRALLEKLFPEVFQWQKKIRAQAHRDGFLVSRYGGIRWFHNVYEWDSKRGMEVPGEDAESSIAFYVQNDAFGKIREAMLEIDQEWMGEYMVNTVHDSLVFDVPEPKAMDLAREVKKIMERPAKWLKHPRLCPEGLKCEVEVSVGRNWRDIKEVEV